jgi:hypothetical protein
VVRELFVENYTKQQINIRIPVNYRDFFLNGGYE